MLQIYFRSLLGKGGTFWEDQCFSTFVGSRVKNSMRDFEVPQMILEKWEKEFISYTLPETNMAPENTPLEKEIPIGNHHFWVRTVSFREGIVFVPCFDWVSKESFSTNIPGVSKPLRSLTETSQIKGVFWKLSILWHCVLKIDPW